MPSDNHAAAIELASLRQLVLRGKAAPEQLEAKLRESWAQREGWRRGLFALAAGRKAGGLKSRLDVGVDVYSDCVGAHRGTGRSALCLLHEGRAAELTFDGLHERSAALASAWLGLGVNTGDHVAIVLPVGLDYAAALLAALRLGLVITTVAPLGTTYVRSLLGACSPICIVTGERYRYMLPPDAVVLPLTDQADARLTGSHTYSPDATVLRLSSPFREHGLFCELSAAELHESLLRDALLVIALDPDDRVAAPGFDPQQWQPLAMLTTWFAGATWVECGMEELRADPQCVSRLGISLLGVGSELRELLLSRRDTCAGVRSWFRNLNDTLDFLRWGELGKQLAEHDTAAFALLYSAASGGAQLFTPRDAAGAPSLVWPAPGREFIVAETGTDMQPSLHETGVYCPVRNAEVDPALLRMLVAKQDAGWTLGGSMEVGRQCRAYPRAELVAAVERDPRVGAASVVVTAGRWPHSAHVVLLIFVMDPECCGGDLMTDVQRLVRRELGEVHAPDRVEIFALHPHRKSQKLHADWCASQYLSGMLSRKNRTPAFLTLSRLAWIFDADRTSRSTPDV